MFSSVSNFIHPTKSASWLWVLYYFISCACGEQWVGSTMAWLACTTSQTASIQFTCVASMFSRSPAPRLKSDGSVALIWKDAPLPPISCRMFIIEEKRTFPDRLFTYMFFFFSYSSLFCFVLFCFVNYAFKAFELTSCVFTQELHTLKMCTKSDRNTFYHKIV